MSREQRASVSDVRVIVEAMSAYPASTMSSESFYDVNERSESGQHTCTQSHQQHEKITENHDIGRRWSKINLRHSEEASRSVLCSSEQ